MVSEAGLKGQEKLLHMRCNECKATLEGYKARAHHRDVLGHQWQPAYACTACRQAFRKKKLFRAHACTCPARNCGRGHLQSSPASESLPNNLEPAAHDDSNATTHPSQPAHPQDVSDEASKSVNTAAPSCEHVEAVHVSNTTQNAEDLLVASTASVSDPPNPVMATKDAIISMLSTAPSLLGSGSIKVACSECVDMVEGNVAGVAGNPTQSTAAISDHSMVPYPSCVERTGYPGQSIAEILNGQQAVPMCSPPGGEPTRRHPTMVYGAGSPRVAAVACAKYTQHDSGEPSWHCRACMRETCVEPAVTICGHLFCHSCIVRELSQQAACPVCKMVFFVRLHVEKAKS